ncbi:putative transcription factor interactor and regulator CCHC(Zn) family [Rosa chinensis]|uniref:Putative transcription factor interactor and regulator CCHC(Zn) family n=1 Tax=Rosa chinensis TaxID=74649 RepID=A0A2P6PHE7_ROSCH|nr:putative transcription factor interactor and regulator CCHC(Zn) family [Rosa chinensis]
MSDSLAVAGAPLDDIDLVAHILQGLPHEYESFSTSIRVRAEPVSADKLHGLLLSHEIDLEQQNTQNHNFLPIPPTHAFVATTSTRPRLNTRGPYSHFRHNPRPRPPPPSAPPRYDPENPTLPLLPTPPFPLNPNLHNRPRPRCQICGLNNHRAPECFHR